MADTAPVTGDEPVVMMDYFMHLEYREVICPIVRRYAAALADGKILGQRSPKSGLVYVPPRGYCPVSSEWLGEDHLVELDDRGTITNFTIVTPVQYYGQEETEPFVKASVLLDGPGGMLSLQDILDHRPDDIRIGMRVEAVWLPEAERLTGEIGNRSYGSVDGAIQGWRATGEPDLPADSFTDKVY
ncbi:MAG: OB-fold domain-containing protein [Actinomycetes bacterium]